MLSESLLLAAFSQRRACAQAVTQYLKLPGIVGQSHKARLGFTTTYAAESQRAFATARHSCPRWLYPGSTAAVPNHLPSHTQTASCPCHSHHRTSVSQGNLKTSQWERSFFLLFVAWNIWIIMQLYFSPCFKGNIPCPCQGLPSHLFSCQWLPFCLPLS